jgi:hypothetical protein
MSRSRADQLLRDLFTLYSRYGAVEFDEAIRSLESGHYTNTLLRTLKATKAAKTTKAGLSNPRKSAIVSNVKPKKRPMEYLSEFVSNLSNTERDGAARVADLVIGIVERSILPNASILREYARRLDIPADSKVDRPTIARKIGEAILSQSPEARATNIELASKMSSQGSSLQAWSDIIVNRGKETS